MVNAILVISHTEKIASGIKELLSGFAPNVPVYAFGGTEDGRLGTNYEDIKNNVSRLEHSNFLSFYDLGSSKIGLKLLKEEMKKLNKEIMVFDVAMVEGCFFSAFSLENNVDLDTLVLELEKFKVNK
ncbi:MULTISPECIES: hypothetical protein [unclassified Jeotgalibaca]|uniref:PTS sugar transporter subunit IIA domain-containing protein n=1 Tax=unclassified Jeotgalibaca TaxID=2621505 RepID=UPI003FD67FEA